jgi:hypothetical protein
MTKEEIRIKQWHCRRIYLSDEECDKLFTKIKQLGGVPKFDERGFVVEIPHETNKANLIRMVMYCNYDLNNIDFVTLYGFGREDYDLYESMFGEFFHIKDSSERKIRIGFYN